MTGGVNNKLFLYADDSDKHKSSIEKLLKKELETVSDWLIDNKLSLHLGKTESILFVSLLCFFFDLIHYVPSTICQLNRDGYSWIEPVLS